MMEHAPSEYQQRIYDFVLHGAGNAFISAKAGSGKTTTMVEAMKLVPEKNKCIFLAFNNKIVDELRSRVSPRKNCDVNTVHSLGLSIITARFGNVSVDEFKYDTYLRENIVMLSDSECLKQNRRTFKLYYRNTRKLVNLSRLFLCQSEKEISDLANERGIELLCDEADVASKVLEWGREHVETVDYTDMVWLPNELLLKPPKRYDWVFCDEVQDFSLAYYSLVEKCIKRGGRLFSVGDEKQMINGFAGASEIAMEKIKNRPNTNIFTLPVCYRCDRKIVELAKKRVPEIKCKDDAEDGEILYDCSTGVIADGDLVLSRTNAPLAKLYMTLLKRGVKCNITGGSMVDGLIALVEDTKSEELNPDVFEPGVFYELYSVLFSKARMLAAENRASLDDAMLTQQSLSIYDAIQTLKILSEGLERKEELVERLNAINVYSGPETFSPDDRKNAGITLSTIHKAKGMECDRVFILCDPSLPMGDGMPEWEREQEKNLEYVAYTRAKHLLGFVSEKNVPKCGRQQSKESILKEMHVMKALVDNIDGVVGITDEVAANAVKDKIAKTILKKETGPEININVSSPFKKAKGPSLADLRKYRKNEA